MHGACGRTSQPLRAASSPIGEPRKPPLKGLAGVAVLDGVQPFHAKLRWRIAPEGSGAVRRIPFGMHQGEFAEAKPQAPLKGELPP